MPDTGIVPFFESRVVLRLARATNVVLTAAAVAVIPPSIAAVAYGLLPVVHTPLPSDPGAEPEARLPDLSEDVLAAGRLDPWSTRACEVPPVPTVGDRHDRGLVDVAVPHFDPLTAPWQPTFEERCSRQSWTGQCLSRESVMTNEGLQTTLETASRNLKAADRVWVASAMDALLADAKDRGRSEGELVHIASSLADAGVRWAEGGRRVFPAVIAASASGADPLQVTQALTIPVPSATAGPAAAAWMEHVVPISAERPATLASAWAAVNAYSACAPLIAKSIGSGISNGDASTFVSEYSRAVEAAVIETRTEYREAKTAYDTAQAQRLIDTAAAKVRKTAALSAGLAGILGALIVITLMGLSVALLATERHLRALRDRDVTPPLQ